MSLAGGKGAGRARPHRQAAGGLAQRCDRGLVGILCCVGPAMLAVLGVVSAGTAFAWATDLYQVYVWWFPLGILAVAVGTYRVLYALTTSLGPSSDAEVPNVSAHTDRSLPASYGRLP